MISIEKFCNIQTFADQYADERIPKELNHLRLFTLRSKLDRSIHTLYSPYIKKGENGNYIFQYKGKCYPFSLLSDVPLQKSDKERLKNGKRRETEGNFRALKLACSMDLVHPRVAIGNSVVQIFSLLILFQENGIDKAIDYANNLIMNKEDYDELFCFDELNVVDKLDLYNIHYLMEELEYFDFLYEYLLFTKEIFADLSKKEPFWFLSEKYDKNGCNLHNYTLFGNASDALFFQSEDYYHMKYARLIQEVDDFTEKPREKCKHITSKEEVYKLQAPTFGYFTFDLLSNYLKEDELKELLLSGKRYGKCHQHTNRLARSLSNEDTYIVGGKIKENEMDELFHSWIEIDSQNIVLDFNHNIVMNRDKYYAFYEATPISKTHASEMDEMIEIIFEQADLHLDLMLFNYFGHEFMRNIKKNEALLKKK